MGRMRVKSLLAYVPVVMVVFSAVWCITIANSQAGQVTESAGHNLDGKMFTLSDSSKGVAFYHPSHTPSPTFPPWTDLNVRGVSVCLRFVTDSWSINQFFKLGSHSSYSLTVGVEDGNTYIVDFNSKYSALKLQPSKMFLIPTVKLWNSFCLTVDSRINVAQVFLHDSMSIRKIMDGPMLWSGEPVIEFSSFEGQLTDVQVWDYALSYVDVVSYIERDFLWPQNGSVLTWSDINYSLRGTALLEDSFVLEKTDVQRNLTGRTFFRA